MQRASRPWLIGGGLYVAGVGILSTIALLSSDIWAWPLLLIAILPSVIFGFYPVYFAMGATDFSHDMSGGALSMTVGVIGFMGLAAINFLLFWTAATKAGQGWRAG